MGDFERIPSFEGYILTCLKRGDKKAFGEFYDRCAPVLFGFICAMIKDEILSEKTLAQSMMQIWTDRLNYRTGHGSVILGMLAYTRKIAIRQLEDSEAPRHQADSAQFRFDRNPGNLHKVETDTGTFELMYLYAISGEQISELKGVTRGCVSSEVKAVFDSFEAYKRR